MKIEHLLEKLVGTSMKVCLYGAGKFGKIASRKLSAYKVPLESYIDDDISIQGIFVEGFRVLSLEEAIEKYKEDLYIVISNYYYEGVLKRLEGQNFDLDKVFFVPELLIEDLDIERFHANRDLIRQIYSNLMDYKSKIIYKTMILGRKNKDLTVLSLLKDNVQYFPTDIFSYENEVFVDAGAYTGDTILSFQNVCKKNNIKLQKVYAFEPNSINCTILKNESDIQCDVSVFEEGLYDENKARSLKMRGGSTHTAEYGIGDILINVKALDHVALEYPPTLIKMDIEGDELAALRGAENTIIKYKPKLAICIYHKQEDIWEIPAYIKKLVPEYKLYVRNYTNWLDEIVLYAII